MTLEHILDLILEVTRRKRGKLHIPWWLARCQAAVLECVFARLLGRPPPLNHDQLTMLQEDNVGNWESATKLFGLDQVRFREGIASWLGR